jgi:pyruvate ferredoxin oxidoreductase beta subunit
MQALSGAAERGNKFTYLCYDNEAYMNTGIQRSGATPKYASTTTSPYGDKIHGKTQFQKNMPFILASHGSYVATANISEFMDFQAKMKKSFTKDGVSYIQIFSPCPPGWKIASDESIEVAKSAFNSRVTPLYEIEGGKIIISKEPAKQIPVSHYLRMQKRFAQLSIEEEEDVQKYIDSEWDKISKLAKSGLKIF